MNIADIRKDYSLKGLHENDILPNPIDQFKIWFDEAIAAQTPEPNGMTLSTITPDGRPNARIVLLKGVDERGFTFFTNYESRKGQEMAQNPFATLTFWWVGIERQVRIEGRIEKVSNEESDTYFMSRPVGSRLGAWVSDQSQVIENREVLEQKKVDFQEKFGPNVPRPPHWGGYRLIPDRIEFWQGRPSRLHDRLVYTLTENNWKIERLSP